MKRKLFAGLILLSGLAVLSACALPPQVAAAPVSDVLVAVPPPIPVRFWPYPMLSKCGSTADPCNREQIVLPIL
jgi:hypothetical protein